jgi:hypothetical protein
MALNRGGVFLTSDSPNFPGSIHNAATHSSCGSLACFSFSSRSAAHSTQSAHRKGPKQMMMQGRSLLYKVGRQDGSCFRSNSCWQLRRRQVPHAAAPLFCCSHAGDIVINEVLGQPANDTAQLSAARDWGVIAGSVEWIELANRGSSEVRVSSCRQPQKAAALASLVVTRTCA